ncbi:XRE family transcriptional regulator [Streptomyces buecherae]|uniref:XRE family transcriptional regulator n=1 Tax=Streptomyces buecherae TaxID=2763006 RepID=UPI0037887F11
MAENTHLAAAMKEAGLDQDGLADAVNAVILDLTGKPGRVTDRDVRRWLSYQTRCPQPKQRLSVQRVLGRSAGQLGWPDKPTPSLPPQWGGGKEEDEDMRRRTFTLAATGAISAAVKSPTPRIGAGDIRRLRSEYVSIVADDQLRGGSQELEARAAGLMTRMQASLSNCVISERSRAQFYHLMSDVACSAAFAALDAKTDDRARVYLDKAVTLAGLSGNSDAQFHVWNGVAMLAAQRADLTELLAAADAARRQSIARRDPLYKSLAHMRAASAHSRMGDRKSTEKALSAAARSFERQPVGDERAPWIAFYGRFELEGLTGLAWLRLGEPERAEAHFHHTLAALPAGYARNRACYTASLAQAQAEQGEVDLAAGTGSRVLEMLKNVDTKRAAEIVTRVRRAVASAGSKNECVREFLEKGNP